MNVSGAGQDLSGTAPVPGAGGGEVEAGNRAPDASWRTLASAPMVERLRQLSEGLRTLAGAVKIRSEEQVAQFIEKMRTIVE